MSAETIQTWLPEEPEDGFEPQDIEETRGLFVILHRFIRYAMHEAESPAEISPDTPDNPAAYSWWRGLKIRREGVLLGSVVATIEEDGKGVTLGISITPATSSQEDSGVTRLVPLSQEDSEAPVRYQLPWQQNVVTLNGHPVDADHIRDLGAALLDEPLPTP